MSASLVGSEMCIRDRLAAVSQNKRWRPAAGADSSCDCSSCAAATKRSCPCLLYTSDAADDM
eukprot:14649947-Alexandrium_andersonii.AAC.1